jgi:hypothetical protein
MCARRLFALVTTLIPGLIPGRPLRVPSTLAVYLLCLTLVWSLERYAETRDERGFGVRYRTSVTVGAVWGGAGV